MTNKTVGQYFQIHAQEYDKNIHAYYTRRRREELSKRAHGSILEVGTGSGVLTPSFMKRGNVIGLDIAPAMIKQAVQKTGIAGVVADAEMLPFGDSSFDTVICSEVIHYLTHKDTFAKESFRVLRKKGTVLVMVINARWKLLDHARDNCNSLLHIFGKQYGWSDPCYSAGLTPKQLRSLLHNAGFENVRTQGIIFVPSSLFHGINTIMEATPLQHIAIAHIASGVKV